MKVLAGDIGGTNARLVCCEVHVRNERCVAGEINTGLDKELCRAEYRLENFRTFDEILTEFIELCGADTQIAAVCLAVAGPVTDNSVTLTNVNWKIRGQHIQDVFRFGAVRLINDFEANGHGLKCLRENDIVTLQEGKVKKGAPMACVGAGTGLGECFVTVDPVTQVSQSFPSEGGHVEFAPREEIEDELLVFLRRQFALLEPDHTTDLPARVSVERLVSGTGLKNIYDFLRDKFTDGVQSTHDTAIMNAADPAAKIAAVAADYPLASQALEMMLSIYGCEVGNVALKYLPYAGLYICGGIAPRHIERIQGPDQLFMRSLLHKGRVSPVVLDVPIHVVVSTDLGVRGAYVVAKHLARGAAPARSMIHPFSQLASQWPGVSALISQTLVATVVSVAVSTLLRK